MEFMLHKYTVLAEAMIPFLLAQIDSILSLNYIPFPPFQDLIRCNNNGSIWCMVPEMYLSE